MNQFDIKNLKINFKNAKETFEGVQGIDLDLESGKFIALVGESGSGKSLTAMSLMRLLPKHAVIKADQMILTCNEKQKNILNLSKQDLQKIRGNEVAIVFQDPSTSLNPLMKIGRQLTEALMIHNDFIEERAAHRAKVLLRKVGLFDADLYYNRYPHQLSGGQKQRVLLAMALMCEPAVLIADEPTTALDVTLQKQILDILKDLQNEMNLAILFITHDLSLVSYYADFVHVMKDGQILESGKPKKIFKDPQNEYTQKLIAAMPEFLDFSKKDVAIDAPILLETKSLSQSYEKSHKKNKSQNYTLKNIDFSVCENEILGIVGESGSGKSTLAKVLKQLLPFDEGQLFFESKNIKDFSKKEKKNFCKNVQMIFQEPVASLNPKKTIFQTLKEVLTVHKLVRSSEIIYTLEDGLKQVGLAKEILNRYPSEVSGGQAQRIAILRAILIKPKILIADEITSSLDVTVQKQILELLLNLKEKIGLTLVFISHDLKVVEKFCHRIYVMHEGQIKEELKAKNIPEAKHPYTISLWNSAIQIPTQ